MFNDANLLISQVEQLFDGCSFKFSDVPPAVWAEMNIRMSEGNFKGPLSYYLTPFWVEIINNLSPYSPYVQIALMAAAQGGKTKTIFEPLICYLISQHPCNIGFISGNQTLADEAMIDLDKAIAGANISHLIRPQVKKSRNSRTGDTGLMKEYMGGNLISGSATNHATFRRRNWKYILCDDIDEASKDSAKSGNTVSLIKIRGNSYGTDRKEFWCSTPLLLESSIIYTLYMEGDQCKWNIPCPHCQPSIPLEWEIKDGAGAFKGGMYWKLDAMGNVKKGSVEYVCQNCGNGFKEKEKFERNNSGLWIPSGVASREENKSYYWNSIYNSPGMDGWETLVNEYVKAKSSGDESKLQTFWNLRVGLPFEKMGQSLKATSISGNTRPYKVGIIPEKLSKQDGNGHIILITCASDLNGWDRDNGKDDVRLDWEIKAHSESGAAYSIAHGSIGTWDRGGRDDQNREKWTCELNKPNCVWDEWDNLIDRYLKSDYLETDPEYGCVFQIHYAGVDTGAFYTQVRAYLDSTRHYQKVVGLRGKREDVKFDRETNSKYFVQGKERSDEYFLQVGVLKDEQAQFMRKTWNPNGETDQPPDFMNFPDKENSGGLYGMENYFEHFESEICVLEKGKWIWKKKNSSSVNHMFDCSIYGYALKNIWVDNTKKMLIRAGYIDRNDFFTWTDYADYAMQRRFTHKIDK